MHNRVYIKEGSNPDVCVIYMNSRSHISEKKVNTYNCTSVSISLHYTTVCKKDYLLQLSPLFYRYFILLIYITFSKIVGRKVHPWYIIKVKS